GGLIGAAQAEAFGGGSVDRDVLDGLVGNLVFLDQLVLFERAGDGSGQGVAEQGKLKGVVAGVALSGLEFTQTHHELELVEQLVGELAERGRFLDGAGVIAGQRARLAAGDVGAWECREARGGSCYGEGQSKAPASPAASLARLPAITP